ncbi:rSAM/selenodomain-associated transferase 2 [Polymorphobacter multimanifer]|uniref:RSAM/selenodomain-associated transferase 2 n=1 Tax=Polymorphobacter multimanifer TaxID=1070431 RepID=A0A841L3M1_9SPHN|nr:TIGR04283 family arsenosugar biosynthesis glycosyltransferase [Polymorphobacter multimanifer]MBB6227020.1 rSAM/selenodomain-associated transferase 2 [Polymorphobacter multimanifer]
MSVAIIIPAWNEATTLPRLARCLASLDPQPAEILLVDGDSSDGTLALAQALGIPAIRAAKGRGRQCNAGVAATTAPIVLILHADTWLPDDAVAVAARTMADPRTVLAGFTAILAGPEKTRWVTSAHNWLKTFYAPALFRPWLFVRGGRLLFGDHAMFMRRTAFEAIGGFDESLAVMEEADLCVRIVPHGRTRLLSRTVTTSDRRVAAWGEWKANWIYLKIGIRWGLGVRVKTLGTLYPDVR